MSATTSVRRAAGVIVLLGTAGVLLMGSAGMVKSCEQEVGPSGSASVVTVCHAPRPDDVWAGMLMALVFFLPDVGSVSLPGLGSITRRVEEQERRQAVTQLGRPETDVWTELDTKATMLRDPVQRLPGDERRRLEHELEAIWEDLREPQAQLGVSADMVAKWSALFADHLDTVRAVVEVPEGSPRFTEQELERAVAVARRLRQKLLMSPAPPGEAALGRAARGALRRLDAN